MLKSGWIVLSLKIFKFTQLEELFLYLNTNFIKNNFGNREKVFQVCSKSIPGLAVIGKT